MGSQLSEISAVENGLSGITGLFRMSELLPDCQHNRNNIFTNLDVVIKRDIEHKQDLTL